VAVQRKKVVKEKYPKAEIIESLYGLKTYLVSSHFYEFVRSIDMLYQDMLLVYVNDSGEAISSKKYDLAIKISNDRFLCYSNGNLIIISAKRFEEGQKYEIFSHEYYLFIPKTKIQIEIIKSILERISMKSKNKHFNNLQIMNYEIIKEVFSHGLFMEKLKWTKVISKVS
jgi:hypothetical protein